MREAGRDGRVDQGPQRRPVALDIEDDDRGIVQPDLLPGHDLERLVEGPEAARQHDEGVRHREHPPLAIMHAVGDDPIGELTMTDLVANQEVRDDADHLAAGGQTASAIMPIRPIDPPPYTSRMSRSAISVPELNRRLADRPGSMPSREPHSTQTERICLIP